MQELIARKSLLQGASLSAEKVKGDICPECPFKKAICAFMLKIWLADPAMVFICPGMRAWVAKSN